MMVFRLYIWVNIYVPSDLCTVGLEINRVTINKPIVKTDGIDILIYLNQLFY